MLNKAREVAKGFETQVANMNKQFNDRLDGILKAEQDKIERLERKKKLAEMARLAKEQERMRKLRGRPFNFSTTARAQRKHLDFNLRHSSSAGLFTAQISNLAYERSIWGKKLVENGVPREGLMSDRHVLRHYGSAP